MNHAYHNKYKLQVWNNTNVTRAISKKIESQKIHRGKLHCVLTTTTQEHCLEGHNTCSQQQFRMATDYSIMLLSPHIPVVPSASLSRSSSNSSSSSSSSSDCSSSTSSSSDDSKSVNRNIRSPSSPSLSSPSSSPLSSTVGRCLDYGKCVESCAAYGRVCPLAAYAASHAASLKMESILADSQIFRGQAPDFPRTVKSEDVILGQKLGEGGFCYVYACSFKDSPLDESCAIKYLRPCITCQKKSFEHGAADLATEAFFLAKLNHPNIVKLRAVTTGSVESNVCSGRETGFFLVVDRLVETLEQRLQRWRVQMGETSHSLFYRMSKEYKDKQRSLLKERLKVALDIASVMSYLQSLDIAYRDLKPDNVGFDRDGTLKLFDLGLCKEEKHSISSSEGRYCMTGHTGSRRYMAPEGKLSLSWYVPNTTGSTLLTSFLVC